MNLEFLLERGLVHMLFADGPSGGGGGGEAAAGSAAPESGGGSAPAEGGGAAPASAESKTEPTAPADEFGPEDIDDDAAPEAGDEKKADDAEPKTDEKTGSQEFTQEHFDVAKQLGLTPEKVKAFGTVENFITAANAILDARDQAIKEATKKTGEKPADGKPPEAPKPGEGADANPIPKFGLKFEHPDDMDPDLVKQLNGINDHYHGVVTKIVNDFREAFGAMNKMVSPAIERQFTADLDAAFAALPEEFSGIVGQGTYRSLNKSGPEFQARRKVIELMNKVADPQLSLEEVCLRSVRALYGGQATENLKTKARQELTKKVKDQDEQIISRPTQREGNANPPGERAAREAIRRLRKDRGYSDAEDESPGI